MLAAISHQWREQFDLPLRLEDGLMSAVEVVEMSDQRLDARCHIERFQHVAAYEVGKVTH